ncbi:MAG: NUDIX hydrolase [Deltaproteobacteria bacterium]|nr:NUDIX hydrolase [Deltaproteobacteria bacterium]
MPLPQLPRLAFCEVEDLTPSAPSGFLQLRRRRLTLQSEDGRQSPAFVFDNVDRRALDAVVIAAHYGDEDGRRWVFLRSAVRPAVGLRPVECRPLPEPDTLGVLWELPAGLVEPEECSAAGLQRCAARELHEELGFRVGDEQLQPLGRASFPATGVLGERHHYFHVQVAPRDRGQPAEDGSVLERDALIAPIPLDEALQLVREGVIEDSKTELRSARAC